MTIDHLQAPLRDAALAPPRRRSQLPRAYVGLWVGLSALSAVYLTLAAFDSGALTGSATTKPMAASAPEQEAQKQIAETRKLREAMSEFQYDIARLKTDLERRGGTSDVVGALSAIEERASLETGRPVEKRIAAAEPQPQIAAVEPQPALQPAQPSLAQQLNTAALETGSLQPLPASAVKPAPAAVASAPTARPAAPPVQAPAQPIAFGAAVVKPAGKPFAIQLGSSSSLDDIRANWTQLAEEQKDALRNLQPRVAMTETESAGTTYDLLAGPVKSAVDARKICKTLASRGIDCKVSPFTGNAL